MLGAEVHSIDCEKKIVELNDDYSENFDKLIIATGSHAFVPPMQGTNLEHVKVIRTRTDADEIMGACKQSSECVCIGGGLLGLETAGALKHFGIDVTVLESFEWLLPRQLDHMAGSILEEYIASLGIAIRTDIMPKELVGDKRVEGVVLQDGTTLPADLVIVATGVRSNTYLARMAGLNVDRGIVVDNTMMTSHPDIYAAGEAAEHNGITYGTWGPCNQQGIVAGTNAAGSNSEFTDIPPTHTLKVLGYKMFSIGTVSAPDGSYRVIQDKVGDNFYCFLFHDNRMVGSILMGDTALSSSIKAIVERGLDCSSMLLKHPSVSDILESIKNWDFS
jgi:nitrite reductase (NADH) large subunit